MNLSKSKLSVAIAIGIGILGGSTQAFACVVSPDSILTEGETLQLIADCTGADGTNRVEIINWNMAVGDGTAVSITGDVLLRQPKPKRIYLTTPIGLTANGTGEYTFSVTGTYTDGTPNIDTDNPPITTVESAKVIVKPASVAVALALGTTSVTPVPASCGTADGAVVASMPTGTAQCSSGKGALAISGPSYFTWTCLSTTGGAEDNCYATRTGYVAPVEQTTTVNGACGTANNGSFSSAPTTNLCGTTYGNTSVVTGSTYTWTCNGSNTAVTSDDASCSAAIATTVSNPPPSSSSSGDPGIGSGLWVPPSTTNRTVADQSGNSTDRISYVPGCLNGAFASSSSSGCSLNTSFTGLINGSSSTVSLGSGKQLVLRYQSQPTAGTSIKYFKVKGFDGGNVSVNMRVWLSTDPAASYANVASACKNTSTRLPVVFTGPGYCTIAPNTVYYLGVEYDEAVQTRFQVDEMQADFL